MKLRLLVVDDHPVLRAGIRVTLTPLDFEISEAATPTEALELIESESCDAVLLDVRLRPFCGFQLLISLRQSRPLLPVVMTSLYDHPLFLTEADRLGASGFVVKSSPPETIARTVQSAVRGERAFSRDQAYRMNSAQNVPRLGVEYDAPLTLREVKILQCVGRGQSNRQIAEHLEISAETVKEHVQNILGKIGVGDRTQAVYWGIKNGLVSL